MGRVVDFFLVDDRDMRLHDGGMLKVHWLTPD
jgi:hypothetical protein